VIEEMPPQPTTKELPAPSKDEVLFAELKSLLVRGLGELDTKVAAGFTNVRADIAVVADDVRVTKDRVSNLETRTASLEGRAQTVSERVRGASAADLSHDAKLAAEITAREALAADVATIKSTNEAQLAILARLDKVASNPTVKVVLFLIGTLVTGYLAQKGISLK